MSAGSRGNYVTKGNMMKKTAELLERAEASDSDHELEKCMRLADLWIRLAEAYAAGRL